MHLVDQKIIQDDLKVSPKGSKQTIAPRRSRYDTIDDPGGILPQI